MSAQPQVEFRALASLVPQARNARTHDDAQVVQLMRSIDEFGWTSPVLVDGADVVAGHGRILAARRLYEAGMRIALPDGRELPEGTVPVLDCSGWTPEQRRAYTIADNKLALNAGWDKELLAFELRDLRALGTDLDLIGFSPRDLGSVFVGGSEGRGSLAERFAVPPFSVLNAREGWWQARKAAWIALGLRSELGRSSPPGGGQIPAMDYGEGARGDGRGRSLRQEPVNEASAPRRRPSNMETSTVTNGAWWIERGTETGGSIFDPVLCELLYRWFSPVGGLVLDPFAGGSVRGVVASKLGRPYVGVELRAEQVEANRRQALELLAGEAAQPAWHCGDSRGIGTICSGVRADMVLSCPPYADLEVYSDDPADISTLDYQEFLAAYREIVAASCALLGEDRFAAFVVGEVRDERGRYRNLVGDTVRAFQDAGLSYYNEAILVTAVGSLPVRVGRHFTAARKLGKTHQNVLVFVKGDPRRATEACGEVDVSYGPGGEEQS